MGVSPGCQQAPPCENGRGVRVGSRANAQRGRRARSTLTGIQCRANRRNAVNRANSLKHVSPIQVLAIAVLVKHMELPAEVVALLCCGKLKGIDHALEIAKLPVVNIDKALADCAADEGVSCSRVNRALAHSWLQELVAI